MHSKKIEWVDIDKVITNPKNPRKDPSFKTYEMQRILKEKGFEEAITAYRTGPFYCIISGHRRWWAAKELNLKQVPIYLVPEPKNTLDELERLGSIQGNQNDWTPYEWVTHTINLYNSDKNLKFEELAQKLGDSISTVKKRVFVGEFYKKSEIETQLSNGTYTINMLDTIRLWCVRVHKFYPQIYKDLNENYIRQAMLKKYENKCLTSQLLKGDYIENAGYNKILEFISNPTLKLTDFVREIKFSEDTEKCLDIQVNISKVKKASKSVSSITYYRKEEAKKIFDELNNLELQLNIIMNSIKPTLNI